MSGKRLKKSKKCLQNRTLYCIITRKRFEMDLYLYSIIFCERYPLAYSKIFLQLNRQWQNDLQPRSSSVFFYFPFHFSWYKRKPLWYGNGTVSLQKYKPFLDWQQESNISQRAHPFSAVKRKGWDRFQESTVTSSLNCTANFPIMTEQVSNSGWTVYPVRPKRLPGHAAPEKETVTCGITSETLLIK